jgi:AcrR family transcriptional regulator
VTVDTRRTRARKGEGDKLRPRILEAAERLLLETGSEDGVSVRAIAEACGCTPPAIYMHFSDKDDLFREVCAARFQELDRHIELAGAASDDPLESLRLRGKAYISFGVEHPEHYRLLMMTPKADDPQRLDGTSPGYAAFDHLVQAVQRCVDADAFADDPPAPTIALTLWALVHGLTSLFISFPAFDWDDRDALVDLALDAQIEGLLD